MYSVLFFVKTKNLFLSSIAPDIKQIKVKLFRRSYSNIVSSYYKLLPTKTLQ